MTCPRCQHEHRPEAKFCEECAAPLARACANCGAQLSATAKFCSECAHPAGPAAPPASQRFGAPETYTPKQLKQLLVRHGNPFFLEETVRTLVETKALAGERGRYRLVQPVQAIQVPATVQTVLAARIDRLDRLAPDDKRLLQVASVVGKDVPFVLLQAIADLPDEGLRRGLDHLQAAEFLYETGLYPELEYTFKHALTHEVTYGGLLQGRRRELHARIVGAIETSHRDRLGGEVERLAHHALRGELWEKALGYLRVAGAKALARSANTEAAALFDQALGVLPHLPESQATHEQAIDLRFELRQALQPLGEHRRVLDYLGEAETLATSLGDQRRRAWVSAYLSQYYFWMGEGDRALTAGERALATAERLDDFGEAHDCGREAIRIAESVAQPYSLATAHSLVGHLHLDKGDVAQALPVLERALIFIETSRGFFFPAIGSTLGRAYVRSGRISEGVSLLERVVAAQRDTLLRTGFLGQAAVLIHLGEAYVLSGRTTEAHQAAQRGLSLARERHERGTEAYGLQLLGEIASQGDPPDVPEAEGYYRGALTLAEPRGMRPLVAHCHLGLGKLYGRTDKREQAHEHLTTATTMYGEMGMTYWLEKAEAETRYLP